MLTFANPNDALAKLPRQFQVCDGSGGGRPRVLSYEKDGQPTEIWDAETFYKAIHDKTLPQANLIMRPMAEDGRRAVAGRSIRLDLSLSEQTYTTEESAAAPSQAPTAQSMGIGQEVAHLFIEQSRADRQTIASLRSEIAELNDFIREQDATIADLKTQIALDGLRGKLSSEEGDLSKIVNTMMATPQGPTMLGNLPTAALGKVAAPV